VKGSFFSGFFSLKAADAKLHFPDTRREFTMREREREGELIICNYI
jgi:hypothetical protein